MKTVFFGCLLGLLSLTGCVSTPESRAEENPDLFESFSAAEKETILKGEVDLDFNQQMVMMAAGLPDRKAKKRSQLGDTEVWTYYKYHARPIHGYGAYGGYFSYSSYYGCYVRRPYFGNSYYYADRGEREKNLVVDFKEGKVVAFEMVQ